MSTADEPPSETRSDREHERREAERRRSLETLGRYGGLGLQLGVSVAFLTWLGHWADGKLGTRPWLMLLGLFLGFGGGLLSLMRAVGTRRQQKSRAEERDR